MKQTLANRLTMRQLRMIAAIDQYKNILRASESLNMSQPAATKILKDLELDIGAKLFQRTNRGVVATEFGQTLARHAKLILAQLSHAAQDMEDLVEGLGGRVTIGTFLAASAYILPTAISSLRAKRPKISVHIVEGTKDFLIPALRNGELDLVIDRLSEYRYRSVIIQEPLYEETVHLVTRAGHPLAQQKKLALKDLTSWDWILPLAGTTLRRQIDKAFFDLGITPPNNPVESVSFLTNRRLLLTTDMIGIWPYHVVVDDVQKNKNLSILPVKLPTTLGPVGVSIRRDSLLSPAATALFDELRFVAQSLPQTTEGSEKLIKKNNKHNLASSSAQRPLEA